MILQRCDDRGRFMMAVQSALARFNIIIIRQTVSRYVCICQLIILVTVCVCAYPSVFVGGIDKLEWLTIPACPSLMCCDDDDDVELHVLGCRVDILWTNCDQCVSMVQCCFTSTETVRLIRTATSTFTQLLNYDLI